MRTILKFIRMIIVVLFIAVIIQFIFVSGVISELDIPKVNFHKILEMLEDTFGLGDLNQVVEKGNDLVEEITSDAQDDQMPYEPIIAMDGMVCYWYRDQLEPEAQEKYDVLTQGIESYHETITVQADADELEKIIQCVMADRPDLFWFNGGGEYTTYMNGKIEYKPDYLFSAEEVQQIQPQIDAVASEWFGGMNAEMGDYDKAKYIYRKLVWNTAYNDAQKDQSLVSVMTQHQGVCQGYTESYQYLMNKLGIPCTIVVGTADGQPHSWNYICLDGDWYQTDVTWGDPANQDTITYTYFCLTDDEMAMDHQAEPVVNMPYCAAIADNYFYHEDMQMDVWDFDVYASKFAARVNNGEEIIHVRFSTDEAYQEAYTDLIDNGRYDTLIRNYLNQDSINVRKDELHREITLLL